MEGFDRRDLRDRRQKPTPGLSRYTFFGRRKRFRRISDRRKGGYVDRYSTGLFVVLVIFLLLNVGDAVLTMISLDHDAKELNPIVRSAIEAFGRDFWVWKFCIVSLSLILLCIHSKFRKVEAIIMAAGSIYFAVVIYQFLFIASG